MIFYGLFSEIPTQTDLIKMATGEATIRNETPAITNNKELIAE